MHKGKQAEKLVQTEKGWISKELSVNMSIRRAERHIKQRLERFIIQIQERILYRKSLRNGGSNMYLNDREEQIIGTFMNVADELEEKLIILKWKDGSQAQGIYDSYMEDEVDCDMDDEKYEEFWSFIFKAVDIMGEPPIYITEDAYFCVDYRNFPDEILVDNKRIV